MIALNQFHKRAHFDVELLRRVHLTTSPLPNRTRGKQYQFSGSKIITKVHYLQNNATPENSSFDNFNRNVQKGIRESRYVIQDNRTRELLCVTHSCTLKLYGQIKPINTIILLGPHLLFILVSHSIYLNIQMIGFTLVTNCVTKYAIKNPIKYATPPASSNLHFSTSPIARIVTRFFITRVTSHGNAPKKSL